MISQPADVMQPVLLAVKSTKCIHIFVSGTPLSRGVPRKEDCPSWLTSDTKTLRNKIYHFHCFVHCPITAKQLLFSIWALQKRSEQPISNQKIIITDGINVASLLTSYFYQYSFPKAKIPVENIQEVLHSADMELWLKLQFICWINLKKKIKKNKPHHVFRNM